MGFESQAIRGVLNHYGARVTNGKWGGQENSDGVVRVAIWEFNYNDLPDAATNGLGYVIPAGAVIVSAKMIIDTAFTSTSTTTDLTVGLQQADGTEIDDDGLITAAQATQTTIGTAGNLIDGSSGTPGDLIGVSIGANAGELVVTASAADLLTGKARVIVEYIKDK